MAKVNQAQVILYMVTKKALTGKIDTLIKSGFEITSVVRLRDFKYPEMNNEPVTDWLIIFKEDI